MRRAILFLAQASLHWLLALLGVSNVVNAKPLEYPTGVKPGDQIAGSAGEFYRYKSVFVKPPDDEDRIESLKMSEEIKCTACEAILQSLMKRVESNSEDHIMDQLDGDLPEEVPYTNDPQQDRVNQNRKGCNKHFKDEMLFEGWAVEKCISNTGKEWCLVKGNKPTEEQVETFSSENDAFWYVCSATIAAHGSELASFIAERMEDSEPLKKAVKAACKKVADCDGTKLKKRQKAAKKRQEKEKKAKKAAEEREKREADEF
mmetsp:Transcript_133017/g.244035  ORF Transcript_133017/g.244035 Transcript_133017/m.244035 type:complete len:260 (-) Transcript_133017:88-867(-)